MAALVPGSALLGIGAAAHAQGAPPLVVLPATVLVDPFSQAIDVASSTTVDIRVENIPTVATDPFDGSTVAAGLYGAEVHLTFDPAQVQVLDADAVKPGIQITPVTFGVPAGNTFVAQNQADNTLGTIDFAVTLLDPQPPVTAPGVLASIEFLCVAPGTSPIDFFSPLGPPVILVGVIEFGTPAEDIIPIPAIPVGGEIVQGQTPPQFFALTTDVTGSGITVPAAGVHSYPDGTVVPVTAIPAFGWSFQNWTGPVAEPALPSTTVLMDGPKSITANFVQGQGETYELEMVVSPPGSGTTIPSEGLHFFPPGTEVTITASPLPGWSFDSWTGPVADPNLPTTTVLMDANNKIVTANFIQGGETFTLNMVAQPPEGGVLAPAAGAHPGYAPGMVVPITATPNPGWTFLHWIGPVADHDNPSTTVAMDGDTWVTAVFYDGPTHTLTVGINGSGMTMPGIGAHTVPEGELIVLTATPDDGWQFVDWTGPVADPASPVTTVLMDADKSVTANFTEGTGDTFTLTVAQNGNGFVMPAVGVHIYPAGAVIGVSAVPAPGWGFDNWTGPVANPGAQHTTVTMDTDKSITANFSETGGQTFNLNMMVSGSGATTPPGGIHPYAPGSVVPITATPSAGWSFVNWTSSVVGAIADTNAPSTTVTVNADVTVTANFTEQADAPLVLAPDVSNVTVGQTFAVTISTNVAPGQEVSAVDAFVDFDPAKLEVIDDDPITGGVQIAPGASLPLVTANSVDNALGQIGFSAGTVSPTPPSGGFLVATITFHAKADTGGSATPITISLASPRQSLVAFEGSPVAGTHADSAATITLDTPLSLLPTTNTAYVGTDFTVTIETNAPAGQQVSAVDAFVDFDPAYLEVVDADALTPGIQITPGASLPLVTANAADNALGQIGFSAGTVSPAPPSGGFLVATITFHAKVETPGANVTPITISLTAPRQSLVAFEGSPVPGVHTDSDANIDPGATIIGHITLQGGSRPPAGRVVGLTVKLFNAGDYLGNTIMTGTPVMTYTPSTVDTGSNNVTFQIDGVVAGTYDIMVVSGHTLARVKRGVVVAPPSVDVFFTTLLEGNCNNDTIINALDFSILASSYLKSSGAPGWDARADFDMTGAVNALDFSLLAANYLKSSPQEAP